jgi:transcriptional regulator with XRE-family HTH domain
MPAPTSTLAERLQGDRDRRRWRLREAAQEIGVTTETIRAWTAGESIPERSRAAELAAFLNTSEAEILRAMDEQDRQKRAGRDVETQVALLRREVADQNERIDRLAALLEEIRRELSGLPSPPGDGNGA